MSKTIVIRPLVSEKLARYSGESADTTVIGDGHWYGFQVDREATKSAIKGAVENLFAAQKLKVQKVRTMMCRTRSSRTRVGLGKVRYWKKALVQLAPGQSIESNT